MSESMVERVATALADYYSDGLNVQAYLSAARAAIEAMREPNEQMLGAGEPFADHPDWTWQSMIDAALKEAP